MPQRDPPNVIGGEELTAKQSAVDEQGKLRRTPIHDVVETCKLPSRQPNFWHGRPLVSTQPAARVYVNGYRVCRMHGARGGAPKGKQNGNFRHGGRTKEATEASRYMRELLRLVRGLD